MGAAASTMRPGAPAAKFVVQQVRDASTAELQAALAGLSADDRRKLSAILAASEHGRADGQVQGAGGKNAKDNEATEHILRRVYIDACSMDAHSAGDPEPAPLPPPGSLMHLTEHRGITLVQLRDIVNIGMHLKRWGAGGWIGTHPLFSVGPVLVRINADGLQVHMGTTGGVAREKISGP